MPKPTSSQVISMVSSECLSIVFKAETLTALAIACCAMAPQRPTAPNRGHWPDENEDAAVAAAATADANVHGLN